ncbi:DUF1398 family protein [Streptomyces sp. NPDC048425]|uniref:DUF1398 family protein n=1 Tax=Streptomyces sp. NPDC048425 TaxID=3365548 RepID=UPI0037174525
MVGVAPQDRWSTIAALRADQAGEIDFPEFLRGCWEAGFTWFDVDLAGRTCSYHGSEGDSYVETYPAVDL